MIGGLDDDDVADALRLGRRNVLLAGRLARAHDHGQQFGNSVRDALGLAPPDGGERDDGVGPKGFRALEAVTNDRLGARDRPNIRGGARGATRPAPFLDSCRDPDERYAQSAHRTHRHRRPWGADGVIPGGARGGTGSAPLVD